MNILLLNQCFYPDVVATAQYLTELASALNAEGHRVTVVTSRRGYDNPDLQFPPWEIWNGIEIIRIQNLSLGKKSKWRRALTYFSFLANCTLKLVSLRQFDLVVSLTSPPLMPFIAALYSKFSRSNLAIWVMDLNPDEALAHGWLKAGSITARILDKIAIYSMECAESIIVLDRFMQERIRLKDIAEEKIRIIAPWPHDDEVHFDPAGRDKFRAQQRLNGEYVIMYSGNHSPCHPVDTLLEAARCLAGHKDILFYFIGGGSEFPRVKSFVLEHNLKNVICLPYQPIENLAASLSAADMQVVVMGDQFLGIKHPCKIYNILKIGSQVLYIGPTPSHVIDLCSSLEVKELTRIAKHQDVETVVRHILAAAEAVRPPRRSALSSSYSKSALLSKLVGALESIGKGQELQPETKNID